MRDLVRRYFDGELDERQAAELMSALADDPHLAAEIDHTERLLDLARSLPAPTASDNFTDRIMADIITRDGTGSSATPRPHAPAVGFRPALLAASWVLALGLGFFLSRGLPDNSPGRRPLAGVRPPAATALTASTRSLASAGSARMVRLTYQSPGGRAAKVAVAGSFNGWDPRRSPMHREGGLWIADLLLPAGSYDYMFVVDDTTWITDPLALTTRNDGFGRRNAVLELGL